MPRQNTKPVDYPHAVIQQIALFAQNIVIARKRRKETQAQWAKKLGVSQPTMARIESGDPAVSMATYAMCIWLINPNSALSDLIAPQHDNIALEREIAKIRPRGVAVAASSNALRSIASNSPRQRDGGAGDARLAQATGVVAGLAALISKAQGDGK